MTGANRLLEATRPWARETPDAVARPALRVVVDAARIVARELEPFVPDLAHRAQVALGNGETVPPAGPPLFARLPPAA